ncbi:MAG: hypothetical protein AAF182_04625 [Pseudomonadota bacterium]
MDLKTSFKAKVIGGGLILAFTAVSLMPSKNENKPKLFEQRYYKGDGVPVFELLQRNPCPTNKEEIIYIV